ncbi:MAG: hypothetical protein ACK4UN_18410 [Limisphaerales bacterium]
MKRLIHFLVVFMLVAATASAAEKAPLQFLRYIYGADNINITNICHPSDDLWMLRGAKNTNALAALNTHQFHPRHTNVISGLLNNDLYFIELRDGKVDPALNLEKVYDLHSQLILQFIYHALSGDKDEWTRLVTDAKKVQIIGPAAPSGEMGHYGSIIEMIPVARSSKPSDDAKTKTITYRVPITDPALSLTLVKEGSSWKIDSSKGVRLRRDFFYR